MFILATRSTLEIHSNIVAHSFLSSLSVIGNRDGGTGTLPETNMAPENQRLEDEFPFGMTHLQVRIELLVSGSVDVEVDDLSGVWSLKQEWMDTNLRSVSSWGWIHFGILRVFWLGKSDPWYWGDVEAQKEAIYDGDKSFEILTLEDGTFELHRKRSMKRKCKWRDRV